MYLSKKILHVLYVADMTAVMLVVGFFVYRNLFGRLGEPVYREEYEAFLNTLSVVFIYNCLNCGCLTVLFRWLLSQINDELKCLDNRISEKNSLHYTGKKF